MSKHDRQKRIIERYYENRDTIAANKLGDLVSELYLAEGPKQTDRLWQRAATALQHTQADAGQVQRIVERRDLKALADLVNHL